MSQHERVQPSLGDLPAPAIQARTVPKRVRETGLLRLVVCVAELVSGGSGVAVRVTCCIETGGGGAACLVYSRTAEANRAPAPLGSRPSGSDRTGEGHMRDSAGRGSGFDLVVGGF
jgi:hypothetical protein